MIGEDLNWIALPKPLEQEPSERIMVIDGAGDRWVRLADLWIPVDGASDGKHWNRLATENAPIFVPHFVWEE